MNYGYIRVSTIGQLENHELENQKELILNSYKDSKIYIEKFSEYSLDRPVFNSLVKKLKSNDTLIVTRLDRLSTTISESIDLIEYFLNRQIKVHVLNMGLIDDTEKGRLILKNILAFEDLEKVMIVERTQKGKKIARQKLGFKEGRPRKYNEYQVENALNMLRVNGGNHSYKKVSEITGISKSTLIRRQKEYLHKKK